MKLSIPSFFILLLCSISFFNCVPKKLATGDTALLIKESIDIYKEANGKDITDKFKSDGLEIAVLNKNEPVLELIDNNKVKKWYNIRYKSGDSQKTGWLSEDNLVFKEDSSSEAVVLFKVDVYKKPDSRLASDRVLAITERVTYLGYKYSDGNKEFKYCSLQNGEKAWVTDNNGLIIGGRIAVVVKESDLYTGSKDVDDYKVKDQKLNEFDIVAVYPEKDSGFLSIGLLQRPQIKKYYAKENAFSFSADDVLLAAKLNKDYQENKGYADFIETKKTIKAVEEAVKSESAIEYIEKNIKNPGKAIEKIEQVEKTINATLKDFNQETPLKQFMTEYIKKADSTISELNNINP